MTTYTLRYARVVILERTIEVPDDAFDPEDYAQQVARFLEIDGKLGLEDLKAKDGSEVADIQDYDRIWELTEDDPEDNIVIFPGANYL